MSDVVMILERCAYALGNAVVQSLWQCALIGALAAAVLIGVRRVTARYAIWCGALALCAGWFAVTFVSGMGISAALTVPAELGGGVGLIRPIGGVPEMAAQPRSLGLFEGIALLWAVGFVLVGGRFVRQWRSARMLGTRGVHEASGAWAALYAEVRASLGVSARVRMLVSDVARSPMVVGCLTPMVVVPASVLTMMSPDQVRFVLAHELSHIRRYDHVVNMLQVLIETVMFYHPVVWWMSHQARVEREHCCDDAAVRCGGDAVAFARALTELEEVRTRSRAVLALHQGGSLMNRIRRLLDDSDARRGSGSMRVLAAITAAALIAGTAYAHTVITRETPREDTVKAVRAGVESGVLTREQAWEIFSEVIFPDSELDRSLASELEERRTDFEAAGLTEDRIGHRLAEMKDDFSRQIDIAFRTQVLGMSEHEARLSVFSERVDQWLMDRMVEAGELTREEAERQHRAILGEYDAFVKQTAQVEEGESRVGDASRDLTLEGVGADALRWRRAHERDGYEFRLLHEWARYIQGVEDDAEAGRITEREARARAEDERRRLRFEAQWWSVRQMYEDEVAAGRMTVDAANTHLKRALENNGYFTSEYAKDNAMRAMRIVHPNKMVTITVDVGPDGKPAEPVETPTLIIEVGPDMRGGEQEPAEVEGQVEPKKAPVHQEGKLTPMDEAYWHHQGIRSLSEYDKSVEGC